jgi:hypothetical protein
MKYLNAKGMISSGRYAQAYQWHGHSDPDARSDKQR